VARIRVVGNARHTIDMHLPTRVANTRRFITIVIKRARAPPRTINRALSRQR
jgi:hypothetical protein